MSSVFEAMLSGSWSEKNTVQITNISRDIFNDFLQYFYNFEVQLNNRNIDEILKLARQYDMNTVELQCAAYLLEHVTL